MQYDGHSGYSDNSLQQNQQMQMNLMHHQQQQQQQNHVMGPPQQQMFSTINQSQLGLQMGMGHQTGNSPPGSNHNSPRMESSEDSDDSTPLAQLMVTKKRLTPDPVDTTVPKVVKKPKTQKKKKKRDPNEPQKPVSAYALFFRDTQAAIKGQNPNASFGEVSKIVASLWDTLETDRKNSYKKKTETAKKEYLKQLAAYRANLVSKAAVDQSDSMYGSNPTHSSPPNHSPNNSPPGRMMGMQGSPVLTSVVDSMQPVTNSMGMHAQNRQVWHMQSPSHMSNTSPPHHLQGGNSMLNMQPQMSPQHQMQQQMSPQQQMQQQQMSPQQQMQQQMSPQQQMQQQMSPQQMQQQQMSPQQRQPQMSPQQQIQPQMSPSQQQQMAVHNRTGVSQMQGNSPQQQMCNSSSNSPSYSQNMSTGGGGNNTNMGAGEMMSSLPTCLRVGCSNPAIDSPDWDREYCSSECVVSHCKDVFAHWVAQRQQMASNPPQIQL